MSGDSQHIRRRVGRGLTRHHFFDRVGGVIHGRALATLLGPELFSSLNLPASTKALRPSSIPDQHLRPPQCAAKATAVIQLFMNGGPSQMDLFDPKPELDRTHGESYFEQDRRRSRKPAARRRRSRSPFTFAQHGQSGMWVSDVMPASAPNRSTTSRSFVRCSRPTSRTNRPIYLIQSGQDGSGPALARVRGSIYGLGANIRICPRTSCSMIRWGCRSTASKTGNQASCRRSSRGRVFDRPARRFSNLQPDVENARDELPVMERRICSATSTTTHKGERPGQPEPRRADCQLRICGANAARATDALDLSQETARDARHVRHWQKADRFVRPPLPDRPAAGRTGRALRAALHQRPDLGQPYESCRGSQGGLQPYRFADRRAAAGSPSSAACSIARWSCGAENSAACRSPSSLATKTRRRPDAITIRMPSALWMAGAGSKPGTTARRH